MKAITFFTTLFSLAFLLAQCTNAETKPADDPTVQNPTEHPNTEADDIKRGQYLVQTMGCHDCHSPKMMTPQGPAPDPKLLLSGHPSSQQLAPIADKGILKDYALFNMGLTAAVGPWGTSYAANLTPDETGIGNWTLEQFGKALREGKAKGMDNGRMLLPPMPWQNFTNLSDADLTAIWAYLRSVQPVKNVVPAPAPPAG
jgi:hypothetical protein